MIAGYEIRDTRFGIRDSRYEIRDTRFEIRDSRYEIRDTRFEIRDSRYEIRDTDNCSECSTLSNSYLGSRILNIVSLTYFGDSISHQKLINIFIFLVIKAMLRYLMLRNSYCRVSSKVTAASFNAIALLKQSSAISRAPALA